MPALVVNTDATICQLSWDHQLKLQKRSCKTWLGARRTNFTRTTIDRYWDISLSSMTVHDRWLWTIVPLEVSIIFSTGSYHQQDGLCINIMNSPASNALLSGAWTLVASAVTWVTCVDRELPHSTCSLVSIVIQANTHIATIPVLSRTTSHIQSVPLETRQRKASVGSSLVLSIPLFLRVASSLAASV